MAEATWPVKCYIYDVSKGMARTLSQAFIGKQIDGIWHTAIVVYGQEYFFGGTGGIESCSPGGTILGQPDKVENLGDTQIPFDMFQGYLLQLAQSTFRPQDYHLLDHNCNTFSSEVAQFLTGKDIPSYITSLPADVMSTPLGQMIRPFIDAMSIQPSGGHAVFDQSQVAGGKGSSTQGTQSSNPSTKGKQSTGPSTQQPTVKPEATAGNSLPGSTNRSDLSSEREETIYSPFIYNEELQDQQTLKAKIGNKLERKDLTLLDDVYDYIALKDKSQWSLGKNHIQTLHMIIGDGRMGDDVRVEVYKLLQSLVLLEDFISLLQNEPTEMIKNIVQHYDQLTDTIHTAILKMLTNLASTVTGQRFLMSEPDDEKSLSSLTCQLCVNCILSEKSSVNSAVASAVYNLCRNQIGENQQIELGSAILECLQRELPENTAYLLLTSLVQLMKRNTEMCDLASVVGINCTQHEKLSPRVKDICIKAQEFSAF